MNDVQPAKHELGYADTNRIATGVTDFSPERPVNKVLTRRPPTRQ